MIDALDIDLARSVPIAGVAGRYTANLTRRGRELVGGCPACGGTDRFALHLGRNVWNCRGCDAGGDPIDLVMHIERVAFREAVAILTGNGASCYVDDPIARMRRRAEEAAADEASRIGRVARANTVFAETVDPFGTLAETYLRRDRGLYLDEDLARTVRFHRTCPWRDDDSGTFIRVSAVVCAMRNVITGEITAVHRTRLGSAGEKIDRKMLGVAAGAAIMLDERSAGLNVGEGLESAMTARQLGMGPSWAVGSVGGIASLPVLDGVQRLRILAENGCTASDRAVGECGSRWQAAGREVTIVRPRAGCSDLNDMLRSPAQ